MGVSAIVDRYERAWVTRDPREMVACFAAGGTYTAPGADHLSGEAIGEFAEAFFAAFPDCTYVWSTVVAEEDAVAVEWTFSGTMTGALMGIEPTGGIASARGAHIIRLTGDRIASVDAFWDNFGFYEEVGIKI